MVRSRGIPVDEAVEPLRGFDDFETSLGDILRGERATMGKSLLDVQRELKIKATYIAAIENADPSAFESPGFVSGYIRSYARYLNMDPEWVFKTFCDESGFTYKADFNASDPAKARAATRGNTGLQAQIGARDPLAQPSVAFLPPGEKRFSGIEPGALGSVVVLLALIGAIGYGGWSVLQEVQKVEFTPIEETPGVLAQLDPVAVPDPNADDAPSGDTVASVPSDAFDRLYRPQALDVPVLSSRDTPIATIDPGSFGLFMPDPAPVEGVELISVELPAIQGPELPSSSVQVVSDVPPTLALLAVRPSWVRVRAADGTVIFEKILDAGEEFELPTTEEPHVLRAGNSGSLYFKIGDDTFGPAGEGAAIVRDVALSVDAVRDVYDEVDPQDDADLARFVAVAEAQAE